MLIFRKNRLEKAFSNLFLCCSLSERQYILRNCRYIWICADKISFTIFLSPHSIAEISTPAFPSLLLFSLGMGLRFYARLDPLSHPIRKGLYQFSYLYLYKKEATSPAASFLLLIDFFIFLVFCF